MMAMARFWWKWGFRIFGLLMLALGFSGCAPLPAAYMVAVQAVDGVSYVATGKSSTDHLLSAVLDEDCALLRLVSDEPVCKGSKDGVVRVAGLAVEPVSGDPAGGAAPGERNVEVAARPTTPADSSELTFVPADAALTGTERWHPAHLIPPEGVRWAGGPDDRSELQWADAGPPAPSGASQAVASASLVGNEPGSGMIWGVPRSMMGAGEQVLPAGRPR